MPVITKDVRVYDRYVWPYNPDIPETTVFNAGDTICVGVLYYNDNLLPAWFVECYLYFYKDGEDPKVVDSVINNFLPFQEVYTPFIFTLSKDLESGYYWVGSRTVDEDKALVKKIYVHGAVPPPEPTVARLSIVTEPLGAKIYVDGKYVGESPVVVDVDAGYHDIKAVKSGYQMESCSGEVVDGVCRVYARYGEVTTVTIKMVPAKAPEWQKSLYYGLAGLAVGGLIAIAQKRGYIERAKEYGTKAIEEVRRRWPTRS